MAEPYQPTEDEFAALIDDMKEEILADLGKAKSSRGSFLPLSTRSFSELHDYVDANEYGGLCDPDRRAHWWSGDNIEGLVKAQNIIDEWLGSGEARTEKIARWLYDSTYDPPGGPKTPWAALREDVQAHWRNHARRMQADLLPGIEEGVV